MVVEDLGAGAARTGVAHLPEIVRGRDADDLRLGQAGDLPPEIERLIVLGKDGDEELVLGQAELLGDQLPGELDRDVLEIVAEGEVAEHLEEGVVPGGVADIVEVIVLAAGAHAFLRRDGARIGPLLDAGEDVLELHHAGVGEHQRRVVARHERARRHDLVPVLGKVIEKGRPDFVDAAHWERCSGVLARPREGARCLFRHGSNRGARVCRGALHLGHPGRSADGASGRSQPTKQSRPRWLATARGARALSARLGL